MHRIFTFVSGAVEPVWNWWVFLGKVPFYSTVLFFVIIGLSILKLIRSFFPQKR